MMVRIAATTFAVRGMIAIRSFQVLMLFPFRAGCARRGLWRLRLRRAPDVIFMLDKSEEYGHHIDELLRKVSHPEKS